MIEINNNLKAGYLREFLRIREAVNSVDPIGLINGGAPVDEYDPEVRDILIVIPNAKTQQELAEMIYKVFVKWFGNDTTGPIVLYNQIASRIFTNPT
ncbi:hypothetical protein [Candidatus Formimonas warabiya]|uniref:Uncharacterized protein n=1 Tax=Formimonas warabiya TaxID=1761012 RepID=A0A3G1KQ67_FORW1|nr:hypothetical protein [Candidatus Formimonas warabiya]ATW24576.1 hypothetical protein DCMF_07070 [Candidatus Formimonas warabiya]